MSEAAVRLESNTIVFPREFSISEPEKCTQSKNYDIERYEARNGTVDPIRSKEDIKKIADYFWDRGEYRNWCIFILGIHTAFRASDLLRVKVKDVASCVDGKLLVHSRVTLRMKEKKTSKYRDVVLPGIVGENIQKYLDKSNLSIDDWLFPSNKSSGKNSLRTNGGKSIGKTGILYSHEAQPKKAGEPLDVDSFGRIMRRAQKDLSLPYNLGTHSCRKTFGYWFIQDHRNDMYALAWLQKMLNHSSQAVTLHYIGLTTENENEFYESIDYGV